MSKFPEVKSTNVLDHYSFLYTPIFCNDKTGDIASVVDEAIASYDDNTEFRTLVFLFSSVDKLIENREFLEEKYKDVFNVELTVDMVKLKGEDINYFIQAVIDTMYGAIILIDAVHTDEGYRARYSIDTKLQDSRFAYN